jgi:hypothetical protein
MQLLHSKKFQIGWGIWTLLLGVSLAFFSLFQEIHSFDEYINAFITFDLPNSWCPTFLTLYGASLISSHYFGEVCKWVSRFSGLVLLPIGLLATYEFTLHSGGESLPIYIYAQIIHITEILVGVYTVYLIWGKRN